MEKGDKVYYVAVRSVLKAVIHEVLEHGIVYIKITSRGNNAFPYHTGEIVESRSYFLEYR